MQKTCVQLELFPLDLYKSKETPIEKPVAKNHPKKRKENKEEALSLFPGVSFERSPT